MMTIKKFYFAVLLLLPSLSVFSQSDQELVETAIHKNIIKGHIYFLASDELKGRETGSPGIDIAARYLATTFQRYGVAAVPGAAEGFFQNVPLVKTFSPEVYALKIGDDIVAPDNLLRPEGSAVEREAEMIFVGYGTAADFDNQKISGKIAVALAGTASAQDFRTVFTESRTKSQLAKASGALGLVELHAENLQNWNQFKRYMGGTTIGFASEEEKESNGFFKLWVHDLANTWKDKIESKKKYKAKATISSAMELAMPSKNVVGMVEGTDPILKNEFIIYSAHYDHLGIGQPNAEGDSIYNGARDNAVGVVTVMSAAESIAKNPTKRSALFILFTAEEKGLLGSRYYVENPLIPLNQMVYCFNSDNGGYNDTSLTTIIGLERTTAAKHIKIASEAFGLKAIDDPAGEQGLFDRSDNVNFAKKGIPAPTFSLGFTAFDAEIGKYYHQQSDNPDTLDYDYMEKFFRAFVLSARLIANDPETPFWTEGDKYYQAGQQLYNK